MSSSVPMMIAGHPPTSCSCGKWLRCIAMLSSGDSLEMERIVRAMTSHPQMVGGPDAFDTELMELTDGALVSKSGAEGIQCIGRVGESLGLAIKVMDGSKRAKYAIAISPCVSWAGLRLLCLTAWQKPTWS
jgi:L-asparaginase